MPPSTGQLALLILAIAFFIVGGAVSLARLKLPEHPRLRIAAKVCLYWGLLASIGVLVWHSIDRGRWIPIGDNFDAMIWLAILLVLFVLYVQRAHPLGGLDWFVMPIAILLLLGALVFGRENFHEYVRDTWSWVHRVTAYGGAVAFAIAAATGAMYVITSRRLRLKNSTGPNLGSLERLERITMISVTLGFALLTIGAITGLVQMLAAGKETPQAKLVLALAVWVVYAVVLHAPMNPSFRGRKAAMLSVVGFVLMIGLIVALNVMSGNSGTN
jgi:ABC-type uncharacterized transport system permease subunit